MSSRFTLILGGGLNSVRACLRYLRDRPCAQMYQSTNPARQWFKTYFRRNWWKFLVVVILLLTRGWRFIYLPALRPPRNDLDGGYSVSHPSENAKNALEGLMEDASMDDDTVILTTLNEAWAAPKSVFDIFLESFNNNKETRRLLKHLVVVCLDQQAQSRCEYVHYHCFHYTTGVDFSKEARFNSPEYLNMMWKRLEFLLSVLEMGYNFLSTDADILWFRDPFSHFDPDVDFQIASDVFKGNPYDMRNLPNIGFKFVRSNSRTIQFYNFWYASREKYLGFHDQDVLNQIKYDPKITEIGLKMKFLDTTYFGGFCQVSKYLNKVCTMHANCCVGLENKLHDLRLLLEDWKSYLSRQKSWKPNPNGSSPWRVPQKCIVPLPSARLLLLERSTIASRQDTL